MSVFPAVLQPSDPHFCYVKVCQVGDTLCCMGMGDCNLEHHSCSLLLGSLQVIEPVRSRCLCIRVAAPTVEGVGHLLDHVADQENLALPDGLRQRIAQGERACGHLTQTVRQGYQPRP